MFIKRKFNDRGFTLVEIIAVIIILGLILAITIPAVNKQLAKMRIDYYADLETNVLNAGKDYIQEKNYSKPLKLLNTVAIPLSNLEKENFISDTKDYLGKSCDKTNSYVLVIKTGDKKYDYQVCLKCNEDEYSTDTSKKEFDYCNKAWTDNTQIKYDDPESSDDVMYVQYGTSEEVIKPQVGLSYKVQKIDYDNNILKEVIDEKSQKVYPKNINELVGANVNKIITLNYVLPSGKEVTKKAIIYQYLKPNVYIRYGNDNKATGKTAGDKYTSGIDEWASKVTISITPDANDTMKDKLSITEYQYYEEGSGNWIKFNSSNNTMTISSGYKKRVKFRFKNEKGQYSKESDYYQINVDNVSPYCELIGSETSVSFLVSDDNKTGVSSGILRKGISTSTTPDYNGNSSIGLSYATVYGYIIDKAGNSYVCNKGVYKLNYNANGGSVGTAYKLIPSGVAYGGLPATSRTGYTFKHWGVDVASDVQVTPSFTMGGADTTIYAQWNPVVYTIAYNKGTADSGTLPSNVSKGYELNVALGTNSMTKNNTVKSTVTFNSNGGSAVSAKTVYTTYTANGWTTSSGSQTRNYTNGQTISMPLNGITLYPCFTQGTVAATGFATPTRSGYTFAGWFTAASGGTQYTSYNGASNITLYAHWTANNYTIAYNKGTADGGSLPANQTKAYGSSFALGTNSMTKNNTARATVTFNSNGGSAVGSKTVYTTYTANGWTTSSGSQTRSYTNGQTISMPLNGMTLYPCFTQGVAAATGFATPTRTGYTFAGWFTAASGGTQYTSYNGSSNITLYAHWTANNYKITYYMGNGTGGSVPSAVTKSYGSSYTLATNSLTKSSVAKATVTFNSNGGSAVGAKYVYTTYSANGWATSSGGAKVYNNGQTITVSGNLNLYPAWSTGTSAASGFATPSRSGYTFNGWFSAASGGTKYTSYSGSSNITLYAQWTKTMTVVSYCSSGTRVSTPSTCPGGKYMDISKDSARPEYGCRSTSKQSYSGAAASAMQSAWKNGSAVIDSTGTTWRKFGSCTGTGYCRWSGSTLISCTAWNTGAQYLQVTNSNNIFRCCS